LQGPPVGAIFSQFHPVKKKFLKTQLVAGTTSGSNLQPVSSC